MSTEAKALIHAIIRGLKFTLALMDQALISQELKEKKQVTK